MAGHTHTRGTMNITAQIGGYGDRTGFSSLAGAFYDILHQERIPTMGDIVNGHSTSLITGFDASRSWTGETSVAGNNNKHNTIPTYVSAYYYKRLA